MQTDFRDENGTPCHGRVTLAVSDRAACYEARDDTLRCAGSVFQTNFGNTFIRIGLDEVDQVLISLTANSVDGNAMCVHQTSGVVSCMGAYNDWGQFGNGATGPTTTFAPWGDGLYSRIGTGTWDQICAIDGVGMVSCAGDEFAAIPSAQGSAETFWMDTGGMLHLDDPVVFRASPGRTDCTVQSEGLACGASMLGVAGQVIDGGLTAEFRNTCWLESTGVAKCAASPGFPMTVPFLYLAGNAYSNDLCAVGTDGSLWCVGDNAGGQLGSGSIAALSLPARVQPPGSVKTACE